MDKKQGGGYFDDEGLEVNPDLIPKPSLCTLCRKDSDPAEEMFCAFTRLDQEGEADFSCDAFEPTA